jgi:hypothetical protein
MEGNRYAVTTTIFVDAAEPSEATLIIERDLPASISLRASHIPGSSRPGRVRAASAGVADSDSAAPPATWGLRMSFE